jgi:Fic family protein
LPKLINFRSWQEIPLTENLIRQLHRDLLRHSEKDAWHRGEYKTSANSVAAFDQDGVRLGVVFETATPYDTPRLMTELVDWVGAELATGRLHPLLVIGIWAVVFLEIHPFQDGNGRLSRALTTLLLLRTGYAYVPFSSMESVIERNKEAYYLALRRTQGTIRSAAPDWQPWLEFFLRSLHEQMRILARKLEHEKAVMAALPVHSLKIVEFVQEQGRITMREAVQLTGASRNTLKGQLRILVQRGQLKQRGEGRGAWYELA